VVIRVRDEGRGMDDTVKAHLFEPYFTTKENGKGTGLGLCTVYGIIEQTGGGIRVESNEREGTSFCLYLRRAADPVKEGTGKSDSEFAPRDRRKGTVLVVEDEESVRKLVRLTLVTQGFRVLEATGERDALRIQERYRGPINLLLTDVVLPGKSGREIAKAMALLRPGIRIMFMSGYAEDPLLKESLEKNGAVFLGKPFSPAQLLAKVTESLLGKSDSGVTGPEVPNESLNPSLKGH
jgi:CheY-like chemotaxis protein